MRERNTTDQLRDAAVGDGTVAAVSVDDAPHRWAEATAASLPFGWLDAIEGVVRRMAKRPGFAIVLVAALGTLGSAAVALLVQWPEPRVFDEFGYLLSADTFAHGRLTNQPHPLWVHFESFNIIQQPTYNAKTPPGQGLVLALGQVLFGHPLVGVWLSVGFMCGALCWMLFAWVPPTWAVLGGLLAVIQFGVTGYWAQSYWGGALYAGGGALLFGGLRRVIATTRPRDALLTAIGLGVLVTSRPFEAVVVGIPCAIVLAVAMLGRTGPPLSAVLRRVVTPMVLTLIPIVGANLFYNYRVTGAPLLMPYVVHEETYDPVPLFKWQRPRPEPVYNHQVMREYWAVKFPRLHSKKQRLTAMLRTVNMLRKFYLPDLQTVVVLLALPWVLRDRWVRFATVTSGLLILMLLSAAGLFRHYFAVATGLVLVLLVESLRQLGSWHWRGHTLRHLLVAMVVAVSIVSMVPRVRRSVVRPGEWYMQRARILRQLQHDGKRHLVIVRYGPRHDPEHEWVYNEADIDRARVVWAREMDAAHNRALIDYFKDRSVWLLEPDQSGPAVKLAPYHREVEMERTSRIDTNGRV